MGAALARFHRQLSSFAHTETESFPFYNSVFFRLLISYFSIDIQVIPEVIVQSVDKACSILFATDNIEKQFVLVHGCASKGFFQESRNNLLYIEDYCRVGYGLPAMDIASLINEAPNQLSTELLLQSYADQYPLQTTFMELVCFLLLSRLTGLLIDVKNNAILAESLNTFADVWCKPFVENKLFPFHYPRAEVLSKLNMTIF